MIVVINPFLRRRSVVRLLLSSCKCRNHQGHERQSFCFVTWRDVATSQAFKYLNCSLVAVAVTQLLLHTHTCTHARAQASFVVVVVVSLSLCVPGVCVRCFALLPFSRSVRPSVRLFVLLLAFLNRSVSSSSSFYYTEREATTASTYSCAFLYNDDDDDELHGACIPNTHTHTHTHTHSSSSPLPSPVNVHLNVIRREAERENEGRREGGGNNKQ